MLPIPTTVELAQFTGRAPNTFGTYAAEALAQATLMFSIVTKLTAYPVDPDLVQLAKYAIMEMADRLLLEQPYTSIKSGPFQTETIGSYSYSKVTPTSRTASQGLKTGLFWWDLAIDELSAPGSSSFAHGSVADIATGLVQVGDGQYAMGDPAAMDESNPITPYIRIS